MPFPRLLLGVVGPIRSTMPLYFKMPSSAPIMMRMMMVMDDGGNGDDNDHGCIHLLEVKNIQLPFYIPAIHQGIMMGVKIEMIKTFMATITMNHNALFEIVLMDIALECFLMKGYTSGRCSNWIQFNIRRLSCHLTQGYCIPQLTIRLMLLEL